MISVDDNGTKWFLRPTTRDTRQRVSDRQSFVLNSLSPIDRHEILESLCVRLIYMTFAQCRCSHCCNGCRLCHSHVYRLVIGAIRLNPLNKWALIRASDRIVLVLMTICPIHPHSGMTRGTLRACGHWFTTLPVGSTK